MAIKRDYMGDLDRMPFQDQFIIGENDHGYKFAVGRHEGRWWGYALGDLEDGNTGLFLLAEVSQYSELGLPDKDKAILMTGAIAQSPEYGYGGIARWFVEERLRGKPDDYHCKDCGVFGCQGDCEDYDEDNDAGWGDTLQRETYTDLGPCCVCEATGPQVRNVLMISKESPIPEHGWGCFTCGVKGGAAAVVCDECLNKPLKFACRGYPGTEGRIPYGELKGSVEHDMTKHPEAKGARAHLN